MPSTLSLQACTWTVGFKQETESWSRFLISLLFMGRLRTQIQIVIEPGAECLRSTAPVSSRHSLQEQQYQYISTTQQKACVIKKNRTSKPYHSHKVNVSKISFFAIPNQKFSRRFSGRDNVKYSGWNTSSLPAFGLVSFPQQVYGALHAPAASVGFQTSMSLCPYLIQFHIFTQNSGTVRPQIPDDGAFFPLGRIFF